MFDTIENHAFDGCPGIEKEGRFQRRKAMGRESVCDPWIAGMAAAVAMVVRARVECGLK
jgi:hypothetical protein